MVCVSGSEPLGVAGKQGGLSDVVQSTEQHHDTLQAHTCSSVWGGSILESIDIGLHTVDGDAAGLQALCRQRLLVKAGNAGVSITDPASCVQRAALTTMRDACSVCLGGHPMTQSDIAWCYE